MALLGGSNLCPKAIDSDLDVLIGGDEIVDKVGETFEWLWNYMCAEFSKKYRKFVMKMNTTMMILQCQPL